MSAESHLENGLRITRLIDHLRGEDPLDDEDREALAAALESYVAAEAATLDRALGLARRRGETDWRTAVRLARRDELLRALARQHFGDLPASGAARAIEWAVLRYERQHWPADHDLTECPAAHLGTPREYLFELFQLDHQHVLRGWRQIYTVLQAGSNDCSQSEN